MSTFTVTEAREQRGALARWASTSREPVYLTDDHGHRIAAVIRPGAINDLEEQIAHERSLRQKVGLRSTSS